MLNSAKARMLDLIRRVSYVPHGPPEKQLPDYVWEKPRGTFWSYCCCCEQAVEILCDLEDFEPGRYYCGGSPRCCP